MKLPMHSFKRIAHHVWLSLINAVTRYIETISSSLDARILVRHVTGLADADLIGIDELPLSKSQVAQLNDFITQRLSGRPVSKIIGYKEFYGRDFIVTDDVLDPRPDSELIIDVICRHCEERSDGLRILDLGTGSGCLVLTLLAEYPNARALATDISLYAINVAKKNAESLGVCDRVCFVESDWFDSIEGDFDVIISNPPYIESDDIENLSSEVSEYDPILALDGGKDGLFPYQVILPQIRNHLKNGGIMALEHGTGQSSRIKRLVENAGLGDIQVHYDLGGHDRVISAIHK